MNFLKEKMTLGDLFRAFLDLGQIKGAQKLYL